MAEPEQNSGAGRERGGEMVFFPLLFGVIRALPLPSGVAGPVEPDRYVLINPFTQGMEIVQGGEGGGPEGDLLVEMMMAASMAEGGRKGPPPASRASIRALRDAEGVEGGECAVCLEEFAEEGKVKEMPCGHRYHGACIEKWLGMHGSCPICRHMMPEEEDGEGPVKPDGEEARSGLGISRISFTIQLSRRDSGSDEDEDGSNGQ